MRKPKITKQQVWSGTLVIASIAVLILAFTFDRCIADHNPKPTPPGRTDPRFIIGGIEWAPTNVAAPGAFAANPQDRGMFYQFDNRTGWSATDPLTASNGTSTWNQNYMGSLTATPAWDSAADPCPTGWRTPTNAEFIVLSQTANEWATVNGVDGRRFSTGGNTIFLPAAGYRYSAGTLGGSGTGFYWSSTPESSTRAFYLSFGFSFIEPGSERFAFGFNVRCVRLAQ